MAKPKSTTTKAEKKPVQQPKGRPPKNIKGQTAKWDAAKGVWIDVVTKVKSSKPRGRPPKGATWDEARRAWADERSGELVATRPKRSGPTPSVRIAALERKIEDLAELAADHGAPEAAIKKITDRLNQPPPPPRD
mmetsp:Transcript_22460/g.70365  ORF Transcript_22460/g.70365 Transcript_22460/m.70365 type:complete len:135 (+) Transcript_22460:670-1074(+)